MSGDSGRLKVGMPIYHCGHLTKVKDWSFTSAPGHNSDLIIITFQDGTSTRDQGWRNVQYVEDFGKKRKRKKFEWEKEKKYVGYKDKDAGSPSSWAIARTPLPESLRSLMKRVKNKYGTYYITSKDYLMK